MSQTIDPARAHPDHLAIANAVAGRYHELVLRPTPLNGFEHFGAAALATTVAQHLDAHAVTSGRDIANAVIQAAERARAEARFHDEAALQDDAVLRALDTMLDGGVNA